MTGVYAGRDSMTRTGFTRVTLAASISITVSKRSISSAVGWLRRDCPSASAVSMTHVSESEIAARTGNTVP